MVVNTAPREGDQVDDAHSNLMMMMMLLLLMMMRRASSSQFDFVDVFDSWF